MIIAIIIAFITSDWYDSVILNIIGGAFIGGVVGLVVAFILPMDTYYKTYPPINIESLQDNSNNTGSFFLGCGKIEDKMKYVFYTEEKGLYTLNQIDCDLAQIKYTSDKPTVNITQIYPTDSWINNFAIDFKCYNKTYIIEVPRETIKHNYILDSQ